MISRRLLQSVTEEMRGSQRSRCPSPLMALPTHGPGGVFRLQPTGLSVTLLWRGLLMVAESGVFTRELPLEVHKGAKRGALITPNQSLLSEINPYHRLQKQSCQFLTCSLALMSFWKIKGQRLSRKQNITITVIIWSVAQYQPFLRISSKSVKNFKSSR